MDQFVMIPLNENGVIWQPTLISNTLRDAMSFDFSDVFIYSHGWWTVGNAAMVQYSQYTVEFTRNLVMKAAKLQQTPRSSFGVGIHWPSTLSEDNNVLTTATELTTYYQMGHRAEQVGANGLYAALNVLLQAACAAGKQFRLTLIGHSFGCRVVTSALQQLSEAMQESAVNPKLRNQVEKAKINLVLLQAAYKDDELDTGGNYPDVVWFKTKGNFKMLVTVSQADKALGTQFPLAETANNIVHLNPSPAKALGFAGPTDAAKKSFNALPVVPVDASFNLDNMQPVDPTKNQMVIADLTQLHRSRATAKPQLYTPDEFGGSHSDISCPQIYDLISRFSFS